MKVLVPLAAGFEEIEFNTIVDVLRRAGVEVTVAGLKGGAIEGAHGVKVVAETTLDKVNASAFDAIALPGGYPGYVNLGEDSRLLKIIQTMNKENKLVTAICGAPSVLAKVGVLKSKTATIYPTAKDALGDAQYVDARVVVDGKVVTSQGPATAMEFSLKLVELLAGKNKMTEVSRELLVCK